MSQFLKLPFKGKKRPKQLKGLALNPNAAIQARYSNNLRKLITDMTMQVNNDLIQFFSPSRDTVAMDDTSSSQAQLIIETLKRKFQNVFNMASNPLADSMVGQTSKASATALEASLKKLSGITLKTNILTGDLKNILTAGIAENVSLIKSIPSEYFTQVQGAVMRSITTGQGLADLVPFLEKQAGVTQRRARIIARDQTHKVFSDINFSRMKTIGIKQYEWLHSAGSQKPRRLHQHMSGNIYSFDNPPIIDEKTGQRGKPGDLINCRCRAVPIVKFDEA